MLKIYNWKAHIVRTVNQDQFRLDALENIKRYQALVIMDWAMKFLPIHSGKNSQTGSDREAKIGMSLFAYLKTQRIYVTEYTVM